MLIKIQNIQLGEINLLSDKFYRIQHLSMKFLVLINSVSFLCVCPVIDHEFRHHIVKVAVDPRSDSRVDSQTALTMS